MRHDWWTRRERRREESFDEELRYLLDEREQSDPPAPILEYEHVDEPTDPERHVWRPAPAFSAQALGGGRRATASTRRRRRGTTPASRAGAAARKN